VDVEFDPVKDASNTAKHGVSLTRAVDLDIATVIEDPRFAEPRWRAYGYIDGKAYCLAFTLRGEKVRPISLRRAHKEEMDALPR
jgi:uncharacterized DUF497 family protein